MLKIINGLPFNIIGIEAEGKVTDSDYENVFIPAVNEKFETSNNVRLLYYLGTDFKGFSLKAVLIDAKVGMKKFSTWERVALVSDHQLTNSLVKIFGYLLPGNVKVFSNTGLDEAKKWITEF
jgi:hypothetical protein